MGIRGQQERLVLPRRVGLNKLMRIPVSQNLEQSWYGTGGVVVARPLPEVQDIQTLSGELRCSNSVAFCGTSPR